MRTIDADALAESDMAQLIDKYLYNQCNLTVGLAAALMPTIEPEVRHGRWREISAYTDDEGHIQRDYECTNCLGILRDVPDTDNPELEMDRYCPMCGARMDATDTNVGGKGGNG